MGIFANLSIGVDFAISSLVGLQKFVGELGKGLLQKFVVLWSCMSIHSLFSTGIFVKA